MSDPIVIDNLEIQLAPWPMSWDAAKEEAKDGWRLPSVRELVSFFDYEANEFRMALRHRSMGYADHPYWCREGYFTASAWTVNMANGRVVTMIRSDLANVMVVREFNAESKGATDE